jgi:Sec-independent protein translocase protein TatA
MEILGIGPGEFVLILIVLLVVVGPERLPGLARQAGGFLVRARNWLQTSPDAALVLRARQEIDAELASIKASLMEVQVVRDEVMGAAKQLEDSVGAITSTKIDLNPQIKPPAQPTIAANGQASPAAPALPDGAASAEAPAQPDAADQPDAGSATIHAPAAPQPSNGLANGSVHTPPKAEPASAVSAPAALAELESINVRLQAIMADMWALQQQLKQRGALDQAWQPPSFEIHMPAPQTAPLAGPDSAAQPIEDEAVLAARRLLEQLTPMQVSYHAPPVVEPVQTAAELDPALEPAAAQLEAQPASPPAPRPRKRRAKATPEATELEVPIMPAPDRVAPAHQPDAAAGAPASAEAPAIERPAASRRKRRAPADRDAPADASEPVTTEKAS